MTNETITVTPLKTIVITKNSKECIRALLDNCGEEKTIDFIKSLSDFTENQIKGFITLMT